MFADNTTRDDHIDDDDDDDPGFGGNSGECHGPVEDFFVGADAVAGDYGGDTRGDMGGDGFDDGGSFGAEGEGANGGSGAVAVYVPFDPRRAPNERDLVMAMTDGSGDGGMMDYFDQTFLKNWAGPEHWKLRKAIRKGKWLLMFFSTLAHPFAQLIMIPMLRTRRLGRGKRRKFSK